MDAQMRRGLLDVCVLAVVQRRDSYGYQIVKDTASLLPLSESTLYPILKRLEQAKYLSEYTVEHNSRLRKYYRITPAGEERIREFRQEWADMQKLYNYITEGQEQKHE